MLATCSTALGGHDSLSRRPEPAGAPTDEARWRAVVDSDPRFDGRFLYAVRSTGIYCRPTCRARRPHRRNVRFFDTPDQAEASGFRACRLCRPKDAWRDRSAGPDGFAETNAAVMFVDVSGASRAMAGQSTVVAFQSAAAFYGRVAQAVQRHGGQVHKLLGDGVLAIFDQADACRNEARDALACALSLAGDDTRRLGPMADLRIGVHYGPVGIGTVRSAGGSTTEIIGHTVNLAKRLEQLTRRAAARLAVSDEVVRASGMQPTTVGLTRFGRTQLKGCGSKLVWTV